MITHSSSSNAKQFDHGTAQKMKFSIKDFFRKCDCETADLVTFTEEILNGKLYFLCSIASMRNFSFFKNGWMNLYAMQNYKKTNKQIPYQ